MKATTFMSGIRSFFVWVDRGVYSLIGIIYYFIKQIASAEWISRGDGTISYIADKLYAFIGIFMLFKIAFSLINYIINPDSVFDKEKGGVKIITNIIITFGLIILTPFAFDRLYEAQDALLEDDVIVNIILGDNNTNIGHEFTISEECINYGKGTITVGGTLDTSGNLVYNEGEYIAMMTIRPFYQVFKESPSIDKLINETAYCTADNISELLIEDIVNHPGSTKKKDVYTIDYSLLISTVVGIILVLILAGFCLDVALRSVKLAFLEIIAPIPIMSYIDPTMAKKGLFNKWLKEVGVTWADLFLRLAALYFGVYLISVIKLNDTTNVGAMLNVFKILGILLFAKKLPDILKTMFNIDLKGSFQLNPLKKFQDNALGGKQIMGAGTGLAGGALGAISGIAAKQNKGKNILQGAVKGFQSGWKNPSTLKGLGGGFAHTKEQNKDYKQAKDQLKEFDKFNQKGENLFNELVRKSGGATKIDKEYNPDGSVTEKVKNAIDKSSLFKDNDEYLESFKAVEKAKSDKKAAEATLRELNNRRSDLGNNPNATEEDKKALDQMINTASANVAKAEKNLSAKKERHSLVQKKYSELAKTEKALEEYMDRHPDVDVISNRTIPRGESSSNSTHSNLGSTSENGKLNEVQNVVNNIQSMSADYVNLNTDKINLQQQGSSYHDRPFTETEQQAYNNQKHDLDKRIDEQQNSIEEAMKKLSEIIQSANENDDIEGIASYLEKLKEDLTASSDNLKNEIARAREEDATHENHETRRELNRKINEHDEQTRLLSKINDELKNLEKKQNEIKQQENNGQSE